MSDHEHRSRRPWGLLLAGIGSAAILWLTVTGQLDLYIHPRYFEFTFVMAALAAIAAVAAFAIRARTGGSGRGWGAVLATIAMAVALLVVPPATLSSSTAQNRSLNSSVDVGQSAKLVGADPSLFRLRDWAAVITDPGSAANYAGQSVKLTGFITPMKGSVDLFYLSRFVITCCTVDAQPVGVPVRVPGWAEKYRADQWIEVAGTFVPATEGAGDAVLELRPAKVRVVDQPLDPYEY